MSDHLRSHTIELPDGRVLSWAELGSASSANSLVHAHGTGSSRLESGVHGAALAASRCVSSRRTVLDADSRRAGRTRYVAAWVDDVATLVDHLDLEIFAVSGYSGGGPHALSRGVTHAGCAGDACVVAGVACSWSRPAHAFVRRDPQHARAAVVGRLPTLSSLLERSISAGDIDALADAAYVDAALATLAEGSRQGPSALLVICGPSKGRGASIAASSRSPSTSGTVTRTERFRSRTPTHCAACYRTRRCASFRATATSPSVEQSLSKSGFSPAAAACRLCRSRLARRRYSPSMNTGVWGSKSRCRSASMAKKLPDTTPVHVAAPQPQLQRQLSPSTR